TEVRFTGGEALVRPGLAGIVAGIPREVRHRARGRPEQSCERLGQRAAVVAITKCASELNIGAAAHAGLTPP
ncbi:MAG TPA: hypothetical protein VN961_13615, partial [Streptosporangiaceae bacterium]|nr:hypothetical protein [Streptosporangiaceae bacterium]